MANLARQREEVRCLLIPEIKNHVQTRVASRLQDFETARATALHVLDQSVRAHNLEYAKVVSRMMEEHGRKLAMLSQQEKQGQIDSAELLRRTQRLGETRARLLSVDG